MRLTFTFLQKLAVAVLLMASVSFASANAQGILPPDEPGMLQELPLVFNVDTDVVDWEGFTMFPFEGAGLERIENPDRTGLNTTEFVVQYKKGGAGEGGQPWAGFFYHTDEIMEITDDAVFRMKVWSPRADINAMLKFELKQFPDVGTPDMFTPITAANQWVELEWDVSGVDRTAPWDRVVVIMDLDGGAGDAGDNFTWFLDDFEFDNGSATSTERYADVPRDLQLMQNYPNPFNPTTNISFALPQSGHAQLEVFDMLGQRVAVLVNETLSAGAHTAVFDASNLSSGVYLYRLQAGNQVQTRKLTVVK
ncbi:Por secretion system C-terminal sorting domain-containing protein [Cyclonatronum proteinivorum]|uniref:Por secretion system C-terminal sorting domain-containing protein n=1 Tax=Cyclonatronum proteinivorum TaxID=1457365 RepID=A0A345UG16_9BACT|nr:T9SS type A sorting domain-containing protein [Cyclonatronum proteinivorum]AXI99417.1 Por secretion system C-terminal sorting domain-containing protein [Cyclonatronum proteinivorum]